MTSIYNPFFGPRIVLSTFLHSIYMRSFTGFFKFRQRNSVAYNTSGLPNYCAVVSDFRFFDIKFCCICFWTVYLLITFFVFCWQRNLSLGHQIVFFFILIFNMFSILFPVILHVSLQLGFWLNLFLMIGWPCRPQKLIVLIYFFFLNIVFKLFLQ